MTNTWILITTEFLFFSFFFFGKESTCSAGDLGLIPGLGRSPGEGNGYQLQFSCLENSMDCIVHGIVASQTRLSDFHFHFFFFFTFLKFFGCIGSSLL